MYPTNYVTGIRYNDGRIVIHVGATVLTPERSLQYRKHSPTGFEWGYGGSGPSQLALAILLELTDPETALAYYQDFKWDFISGLPKDNWGIPISKIKHWIEEKKAGRKVNI